jgi:hypothetical protein
MFKRKGPAAYTDSCLRSIPVIWHQSPGVYNGGRDSMEMFGDYRRSEFAMQVFIVS